MYGRLTAPEVVVIHGWQVVVNKRVAMDQFKRAGGQDCALGFMLEQVGSFQNQDRPKALAAVQGAVPHGGQQSRRARDLGCQRSFVQQSVENRFHFRGLICQMLFQVKSHIMLRAGQTFSKFGFPLKPNRCIVKARFRKNDLRADCPTIRTPFDPENCLMKLLSSLLRSFIKRGRMRVMDVDGKIHEFGSGEDGPTVTIRLHDKKLYRSLFFNPELAAGEAYMDGSLTMEEGSTCYDFMFLFSINRAPLGANPVQGLLRKGWEAFSAAPAEEQR